jgi:hypothetical protein
MSTSTSITRTLRSSLLHNSPRRSSSFLLPQTPFLHLTNPQGRPLISRSSYSTDSSTPTLTHSKPRNTRLNPPPSTLPPHLDLPEKQPGQSTIKYLFLQGKAYLTFYKAGARAILTNLSLTREPQKLVDLTYNGAVFAAVKDRNFSRADYQLLLRNSHDLKRVPAFGLIFLLCGEMTPFVVVVLSNIVPYTCRIPAQIAADRRRVEARRAASFTTLTTPYAPGKPLERSQLAHISASLGLASRFWDRLGGVPMFLLRAKVERRIEYLETDDALIRRDGGVEGLEAEELRIACMQRGMDVLGREEDELREGLQAWLSAAKRAGVERLLLSR